MSKKMKIKFIEVNIIYYVSSLIPKMSKGSSKKTLPVFNIGMPGDASVYSSYSRELVGYGPMPYGMPNDALPWQNNYGKDFHVIEYNPCNDTFMMHGLGLGSPFNMFY